MSDFGYPPQFPKEPEVNEKPKEVESEIGKDKSKSKKVFANKTYRKKKRCHFGFFCERNILL